MPLQTYFDKKYSGNFFRQIINIFGEILMVQFRKNNKRSIYSKLITYYYKWLIKGSSIGVQFDFQVYLMRFPRNIQLKDFVYIKSGARLCPCNNKAYIYIGKNTTIGYDTKIFASECITIGDNCMIAPNVYIVDSDHGVDRNELMNAQSNVTAEIKIGNDVWIATGAIILKGAIIPDGCIIAANSMVTGKFELEPYSIYGGTPAKKIGERS